MTKTIEENFLDWESHVFGFGYGTGEEHTITALKTFFEAFDVGERPNSYSYEKLEAACGPTVAWLLINTLCHDGIIEYGTSTRYAWLTKEGEAIKNFITLTSLDKLISICTDYPDDYVRCMPDVCNCGPGGYEKGKICVNPFWVSSPKT